YRCFFFFFFQAEDGIRDRNVTGVQTCALPILPGDHQLLFSYDDGHGKVTHLQTTIVVEKSELSRYMIMILMVVILLGSAGLVMRSEERRVGKECRGGWAGWQ